MTLYESAYNQLISKGKTHKQAVGIIQKQFENSGIYRKGTSLLTDYGKARDSMTKEQRAIERAVARTGRPAYHFIYKGGRAILKNIYK